MAQILRLKSLADISHLRIAKLKSATLVFCLFLLFFMISSAYAKSGKITIYFYSSETSINNFKSLKMEFDSYLSRSGPYEFQPFSERNLFEQHIKGKDKSLLFISSWHYRKIYKDYSLKPFLVGVRNGKHYQKRVLVAGARHTDMKTVMKGPVASASSVQNTRSILKEMFPAKDAADSVRVLTVPKDVDALMSVGFQMAKSALIAESALNNLKMLDPVLSKKMKTVARGSESLLMVLAIPDSFSTDAEKIIKVIENMKNDPDGMNIIKMLDLDDWKKIDPSDKLKLEG
ncbi:MAG: phosphate/phosphite/phosphonate ABC transporter substrate-binding protein [Desulfobacteraceae bacterium]|nr:phosphate/phosphite/phosphonate ABC transporter substrate-binding protein [Desulfobacteraceae bacterium]